MLFEIIDVLRYCGYDREVYEQVAGVFCQGDAMNPVGVGHFYIKALKISWCGRFECGG